jgi:hypothetical protein
MANDVLSKSDGKIQHFKVQFGLRKDRNIIFAAFSSLYSMAKQLTMQKNKCQI